MSINHNIVTTYTQYTGWAKKVIPLVHYITLYERYHFFGLSCSSGNNRLCMYTVVQKRTLIYMTLVSTHVDRFL